MLFSFLEFIPETSYFSSSAFEKKTAVLFVIIIITRVGKLKILQSIQSILINSLLPTNQCRLLFSQWLFFRVAWLAYVSSLMGISLIVIYFLYLRLMAETELWKKNDNNSLHSVILQLLCCLECVALIMGWRNQKDQYVKTF